MIRGLLLLLIASTPFAAGPIFRHKDGKTQQEFENAYQDIRNKRSRPISKTLDQLRNLTTTPGDWYYCSDCTTDGLVVSTGTAQGAFGRVSSRTTAIQ